MFCSNCGKEVDEKNTFCSSCGCALNKPIDVSNTVSETANNEKLYKYAWLLICATVPLSLLLRLICQEEGIGYGWRAYEYYYVPTTMRVVITLMSAFMIGSALYLRAKSGKEKSVGMIVAAIIVFLLSMVLVMTEWQI